MIGFCPGDAHSQRHLNDSPTRLGALVRAIDSPIRLRVTTVRHTTTNCSNINCKHSYARLLSNSTSLLTTFKAVSSAGMLTCRTIRDTGAKVSPNRTPSQPRMELLHTINLEALASESDSPAGRCDLQGDNRFNNGARNIGKKLQ
jgi:hypothetical protein